MSDIDETANVESQVADTQEETTVEQDTQQEADETQANESEATEDESTEDSEQSGQADDDSADEGEEQPPKKTKEDYIRERQERKMQRDALRKAQIEYAEQIDPSDWEQRVQAIENERFVERVENNINNSRRDIADAQNLPVFKEDPELFTEIMRDAIDTYGMFHDTLTEADGSPVFLGFYDPRTGAPISVLNVAQREANKLSRVAERVTTSAQVQASQNEAKMRARSDNPGGGKNTAPAFETLPASKMREELLKKGYDIK